MPWVRGEALGWVYGFQPMLVLRHDPQSDQAVEWKRWGLHAKLEQQRGGSQLIPWDDGWLCITHEAYVDSRSKRYLHRFLELGSDFAPKKASGSFYFESNTVEFCAGLCLSADGKELVVSYGVDDRKAKLARVPVEAVRKQLSIACHQTYSLPDPWEGREFGQHRTSGLRSRVSST